ncbi:MAG: hypothetical protein FWE62_00765 [Firmicutes bacterium]|nr:hypothetical protein [Bacillota bacterium]
MKKRSLKLLFAVFFAVAFGLQAAACNPGGNSSVKFNDDLPKTIELNSVFSVEPYITVPDGKDVTLTAEYKLDDVMLEYDVFSLSFTPTEAGDITLTLFLTDTPSVKDTATVKAIEAPPQIISSGQVELDVGETLTFNDLIGTSINAQCTTSMTLKTVKMTDFGGNDVFTGEKASHQFAAANVYTLTYRLVSLNGAETANATIKISVGGIQLYDWYFDEDFGEVTRDPSDPSKATLRTHGAGAGGLAGRFAYVVTDSKFTNEFLTLTTTDSLDGVAFGIRFDRSDWVSDPMTAQMAGNYYGIMFKDNGSAKSVQPYLVSFGLPEGARQEKTVNWGAAGAQKTITAGVVRVNEFTKIVVQIQVAGLAVQTFVWSDDVLVWTQKQDPRPQPIDGHIFIWMTKSDTDFTFNFGVKGMAKFHFAEANPKGFIAKNTNAALNDLFKLVPILTNDATVTEVKTGGGEFEDVVGSTYTFSGEEGTAYTFKYTYGLDGAQEGTFVISITLTSQFTFYNSASVRTDESGDVDNGSGAIAGTVTRYEEDVSKITLNTANGAANGRAYVISDTAFGNDALTMTSMDSFEKILVGLRYRLDHVSADRLAGINANYYSIYFDSADTVTVNLLGVVSAIGKLETKKINWGANPNAEKTVTAAVVTKDAVTHIVLSIEVDGVAGVQTLVWQDKTEVWSAGGLAPLATGHIVIWQLNEDEDFTFNVSVKANPNYHYAEADPKAFVLEGATVAFADMFKMVPVALSASVNRWQVNGTTLTGSYKFAAAGTYTVSYRYNLGSGNVTSTFEIITTAEGAVQSYFYDSYSSVTTGSGTVFNTGGGTVGRDEYDMSKIVLTASGSGHPYIITESDAFANDAVIIKTIDSFGGMLIGLRANFPNKGDMANGISGLGGSPYAFYFPNGSNTFEIRATAIGVGPMLLYSGTIDWGVPGAEKMLTAAVVTTAEGTKICLKVEVDGLAAQVFVWDDKPASWSTVPDGAPESGHIVIWQIMGTASSFSFVVNDEYHFAETDPTNIVYAGSTLTFAEILNLAPIAASGLAITEVQAGAGASVPVSGSGYTFGSSGITYTFTYTYELNGTQSGTFTIKTVTEGAVQSGFFAAGGWTTGSGDVYDGTGSTGSVTRYSEDISKITLATAGGGKHAYVATEALFSNETVTITSDGLFSGIIIGLRFKTDRIDQYNPSFITTLGGSQYTIFIPSDTPSAIKLYGNGTGVVFADKAVTLADWLTDSVTKTVTASAVTSGGSTTITVTVTMDGIGTESFDWIDNHSSWTPEASGHIVIWHIGNAPVPAPFTFNFGVK